MKGPTPTTLDRKVGSALAALVVVTWALIGFGALVRAMKAGLACPDWPLCFGEIVPNVRLEGVIYEFGHRALAGLVAIGYVVLLVVVRRSAALRPLVGRPMWIAGGLLAAQIIMGGLTVLIVDRSHGGDPRPAAWTVTTHLVLGNAFAATIAWAALRVSDSFASPSAEHHQMAAKSGLWVWTTSLALQFVLGGIIASNLAGMVCIEFPACTGGIWFPSWSGFVGLQLLHRLNAYVLVGLAGVLIWQHRDGRARALSRFVGVAVGLQVVAGALNIWFSLPPAVTVVHSALASALFLMTALMWQRVQSATALRPR